MTEFPAPQGTLRRGEQGPEFLWPIRVYYEDTDSGGVVYYANYLKYMERARSEWLRHLGFEQDQMIAEQDCIFAVRSAQVDYLQPARFNDALWVRSHIAEHRRTHLTFAQHILRQPDDARALCSGQIKVACLSASAFRPQPIPEALKQEILA